MMMTTSASTKAAPSMADPNNALMKRPSHGGHSKVSVPGSVNWSPASTEEYGVPVAAELASCRSAFGAPPHAEGAGLDAVEPNLGTACGVVSPHEQLRGLFIRRRSGDLDPAGGMTALAAANCVRT